jgi:membrane peptidoglycan carboxypeptidase
MVALQIERLYTKRQILEMYMNYVFLGAGSYGFEAGSRTYFGKSLKDLNLEEAALLARFRNRPNTRRRAIRKKPKTAATSCLIRWRNTATSRAPKPQQPKPKK